MIITLRAVFLCLISFLAMGCSTSAGLSQAEVEVESSRDILEKEIVAQPTEFLVPLEKDRESWVRARFFFQTYTKGNPHITDNEFISDEENRNQKYSYHVYRVSDAKASGFRYKVSCFELNNPVKSRNKSNTFLRARNLARFIQKGELEVSLLQ